MKVSVKREGRTYKVTGAAVDISFLVLGPIENNTYIISDDAATFVVDPSHSADAIISALGGKKLDAIVVTHHHADHTSALYDLKQKTGAAVYASAIDAPIIQNQPAGGFPLRNRARLIPCSMTAGSFAWATWFGALSARRATRRAASACSWNRMRGSTWMGPTCLSRATRFSAGPSVELISREATTSRCAPRCAGSRSCRATPWCCRVTIRLQPSPMSKSGFSHITVNAGSYRPIAG